MPCSVLACGREKVCGSLRWGIYKGCCDNDGKLLVYVSGKEVCVTESKADLVLWMFSPLTLTWSAAVVLYVIVFAVLVWKRFSRARAGD